MNRRRIAIGVSSVSGLAVVAAGAMSMAGSGGSAHAVDLHATPLAAVSDSVAATLGAGTAQADTVVSIASPAVPARGTTPAAPPRTLTMHGTGLFDFGKRMGSLDIAVPTGEANEVLTPGTVYVRRGVTAAAPASPWSPAPTARISDGDVISGGATDPELVFAMLGGVQPGVREVGQDTVRGVPVVHYQGTLDLAQAAAASKAPASPRSAASANAAADKQALTNAAYAFLTTKVPFDAYLDAQGRLRRFVAAFSYAETGPTKPVAQVTSATELFGFGTPVSIAVPAVPAAGESVPGRGATTPSAHSSSPKRAHK